MYQLSWMMRRAAFAAGLLLVLVVVGDLLHQGMQLVHSW